MKCLGTDLCIYCNGPFHPSNHMPDEPELCSVPKDMRDEMDRVVQVERRRTVAFLRALADLSFGHPSVAATFSDLGNTLARGEHWSDT